MLTLSTLVFAQSPAPEASEVSVKAERLVKQQLLSPLKVQEDKRSRFSRARLPPSDRRVRVLDGAAKKDKMGNTFVRFAVDGRYGLAAMSAAKSEADWTKNEIRGCVYADSGEIFVQYGKQQFRDASVMLGKKTKPAAEHTCVEGDGQLAAFGLHQE